MSDSRRHPPQCMRCGAPAGNGPGAELRPIKRLPARHRIGFAHPRSRGDTRRRVPYGFVHDDAAFCARRMPNARRTPFVAAAWGSY